MTGKTEYRALAQKVIAVAFACVSAGDWAAYIDAVPGEHHALEWQEVAKSGCKLPQNIAEALFPEFAKQFRWRD
jgi:hypothetical protein